MVEPPRKRGLEFDNYLVLLQAAVRGEGVALCGGRLAEDFIARGDLVRPIKATLRSDRAFYILYPDRRPLSGAAVRNSATGWWRRRANFPFALRMIWHLCIISVFYK